MLSQSEMRLYVLNNASVGGLGLGGGEGDGTFAGAPLYTILQPVDDERSYLAQGHASNVIPTLLPPTLRRCTRTCCPALCCWGRCPA